MLASDALNTMPAKGEIRTFPAGAEAPKWLVDLEPFHPGSVPAPIYFSGPTDVINTGERFIVLPLYAGLSGVGALNTAAQGCNIFAGTQEVRMVTAAMILAVDPMAQPSPAVTNPQGVSQDSPPTRSEEPRKEVGRVGISLTTALLAGFVSLVAGGFLFAVIDNALHLVR